MSATCPPRTSSLLLVLALAAARGAEGFGRTGTLPTTDVAAPDPLPAAFVMRKVGPGQGRNPVILVPGLAGSQMKAILANSKPPHFWCESSSSGKWLQLWVSVLQVLPTNKDCLMSRIATTFDAATNTYSDAPGVTLDTNVDFGGVDGVASLDPTLATETGYFKTMIEYFEGEGYTAGQDLHGAPYDWRMAPDGLGVAGGMYTKLQALVEKTYELNGLLPVHLVTHSLGGPVILGFLTRMPSLWKKRYVASFIPISAPFAGSVSQAKAFVSGDNLGYSFIPADYLRPIQVSAASGPFLISTPESFGADKVIVTTDARTYTSADWHQMLLDLGHTQAAAILSHLHASKQSLVELGPPNVTTHVVYSHGVKTDEGYVYSGAFAPAYQKVATKIISGDGDGTVNLLSLQLPQRKWKGKQPYPLSFWNVSGVAHLDMISNPRVLAYIGGLIGGQRGQN